MSTRTQSALAVIEQPAAGVVEYNLDRFPTSHFNRLIPTQAIVTTDLLAPVVQIVALDVERDSYKSPDVPEGHRAINRVGLRKLATAAAVSIVDERRTDDGSDPNVCEVTCAAEMTLPTGQRIRAPGMKRVDLGRLSWASDKQRAKYAATFQEHVASRAENRAVRALLSLQASYPVGELAKPFAVVSYAPNMAHPEVRARILDAMVPTVAALYGPAEAKQLAAGEPVTLGPAADDEEQPAAGAGPEEPAWLSSAPAAPPSLAEALRRAVEVSTLPGPATDEQLAHLGILFAGWDRMLVGTGIRAVWGPDAQRALTAAQAEAILAVARDDEFAAHWARMVEDVP